MSDPMPAIRSIVGMPEPHLGVQKIDAAIAELERLRRDSTPGNWHRVENAFRDFIVANNFATVSEVWGNNADLILAMHSVIDATLDNLRLASAYYSSGIDGGPTADAFADMALRTADDIVKVVSS